MYAPAHTLDCDSIDFVMTLKWVHSKSHHEMMQLCLLAQSFHTKQAPTENIMQNKQVQYMQSYNFFKLYIILTT